MKNIFDDAVKVLKANSVEMGLRASMAYYNQIWARDAFISFLGANQLRDESLVKSAKDTVSTFAKTASPLGKIANFFDLTTMSPEFGYSGSTDSTSWYIIGLASLYEATRDRSLLREPLKAALNGYRWLRYQDANNVWLIDSPQGADWMDAAVQRTGKTPYNNALFLMASLSIAVLLSASGETLEPYLALDFQELKQRFQDVFLPDSTSAARVAAYWPRLATALGESKPLGFSRRYFLHFISFARVDTRFDTLSNLMCVLSGLRDLGTSHSILSTMKSKDLSRPYPSRVLDPP